MLPVREMVLYKHGVGYFVRGGNVDGTHVSLTFRKDEINDVLKSLSVFDLSDEGLVLGVHYQTPMDRRTRLASSSIRLSVNESLIDLIGDLRGRHTVMNFETLPGRVDTVTGRVIGIDIHEGSVSDTRIVLVSMEGHVRVFPISTLRTFTIEDASAEHDLQYFLDTSMSEDDRRTVNVRLNEGSHELVVSYVAPSPTWRVSYRLIAETDETNPASGKALIQGWGLFDNRLDEDLDDVRVTLVAGQPISFIYDLYTSSIPQRRTIREQRRTTGPVEYDAPVMDAMMADSGAEPEPEIAEERPASASFGTRGSAWRRSAPRAAAKEAFRLQDAAKSTKSDTQTKDTGETFQYVVNTPVSVKRGESALVPIIGAEVEYERVLLYNQDKLPNHPVAALRFTNNTGLTLERGPVTLVENSDYKGEAIVPFTKADGTIFLTYAVELGVRVAESSGHEDVHHTLYIKDRFLVEQRYAVEHLTYTVENTTDKPQTVTLEQYINPKHDLYETRDPDVTTLDDHHRWKVDVGAKSSIAFTVKTRNLISHRHKLRDLRFAQVQRWAEKRYLDQEIFEGLSELLRTINFVQETHQRIRDLEQERKTLFDKQENIRANLGALSTSGKEGDLRERVLNQLAESQDRAEAIDREIAAAQRTIDEAERQIDDLIPRLDTV